MLKVLILIGSSSDAPCMSKAKEVLDGLGIACKMHITSAHRTPERTRDLVEKAGEAGCQVIICGAGMAAHLAGAVAAETIMPVIGVPLTSGASPLAGVDALLSTVQMPPGMPVSTVAINGAKNAAWLAAQILALSDPILVNKLHQAREVALSEIYAADEKLQAGMDGSVE
ncbi:MAG: 5-(carboxyamino)imidazole ribonucleotide mutase [Parcubacteria group bacterium]|jgi:5-(carboxyamino)imidazole ribonucleotide mutase